MQYLHIVDIVVVGLDAIPHYVWHAPKLLVSLEGEPKVENNRKVKSLGHAP
jgi:hypothetical protein